MATILIIDDEPLVRKTVRLTLERAGHRVAEAVNGREGEKILEIIPLTTVLPK